MRGRESAWRSESKCVCMYNAKVETLVTVQCSLKFIIVTVRRSARSEREGDKMQGVRYQSVCVCTMPKLRLWSQSVQSQVR